MLYRKEPPYSYFNFIPSEGRFLLLKKLTFSIKPIEHPHVGFLHLEDILLLGVVVAAGGISLFLFKIAAERMR